MEAAEPEVRWAGQGRKGLRALGLVLSPVSPSCRPLKHWFFPQVPKNNTSTWWPHSATKIAVSTPGPQPKARGQETPSAGQQGEFLACDMQMPRATWASGPRPDLRWGRGKPHFLD